MDHQIGAEAERLLQGRRQEGVVHRRLAADGMGAGADVRDVHHSHQRIGRRFDQDEFGLESEGGVEGDPVVLVDELHVEMTALRPGAQQAVGAAVQVVRGDQQVAGLEREQGQIDRRHTRCGDDGSAAAFEFRQRLAQHVAGRIA